MSDRARPVARRKMLLIIGSSLTVIVVAAVAWAVTLAVRAPSPTTDITLAPIAGTLRAGKHAPVAFRLDRLGGGSTLDVAALAKGRPTVLNFFASWCTDCRAELGAVSSVARTLAGKVTFIGIDTADYSPSEAKAMLKAAGITFPIGTQSATGSMVDAYAVPGLPTTVFIDANGRFRGEHSGAETVAALTKAIDPLLVPAKQ